MRAPAGTAIAQAGRAWLRRECGSRAPSRRAASAPTVVTSTSRQLHGLECVHIAIDDCTRRAYAEVLPDQTRRTAIGFLETCPRLLRPPRHRRATDPDRQRRCLPLHDPRCRLRTVGIRHLRTRAYRPQPTAKPNASSAASRTAGRTARSTDQARKSAPQPASRRHAAEAADRELGEAGRRLREPRVPRKAGHHHPPPPPTTTTHHHHPPPPPTTTTHHHHPPPPPTTTTHHHHPPPPPTTTTHHHHPPPPPTTTTHHHHPPPPPTTTTHHHHPPPPPTTTTHHHHPPPPPTTTTHPRCPLACGLSRIRELQPRSSRYNSGGPLVLVAPASPPAVVRASSPALIDTEGELRRSHCPTRRLPLASNLP